MGVRKRALMWRGDLECLEDRQLLSLTLSLVANDISPFQGKQFSGAVATLIDLNLTAQPSNFTVSIVWQNGQPPTSGTVASTSIPGTFEIDGSYTYAQVGTFNTQITVTDTSNNTAYAEGVAHVSPQPLTILGTAISGTESQALGNVVVANFIDPNSADLATQFNALVGWGDGDSSLGVVQGGPNQFSVLGNHTYASPGTYTTTIAVVGQGNVPGATATGTATIASSPANITMTGQSIVASAGQALNDATVATFTVTTTTGDETSFPALIDWGVGQTSQGTVTPQSTPTGGLATFAIQGSHTYLVPGSYTITVTLSDQTGDTFTSTSTADVVNTGSNFNFSGMLSQIPGNGPNAAQGYTDTNRPTFSGTVAPFSTVKLFARPSAYDANEPLGTAIASGSGQWNLATGPLADGIYTVTAVVTPAGGTPSAALPLAGNGLVVIDTVAPQVVRVANGGGNNQVKVFFRDDLSGMDLASLMQTSNYVLADPHVAGFHPSAASVLPGGGNLPTDVVGVLLTIPGNRRTLALVRGLRISGTNIVNFGTPQAANVGITDNAGNPLAGYYQGLVSSASGRAGGNYHVKIRAQGVRVRHG